MLMKQYKLRNDVSVPCIGLGTWQITNAETMQHIIEGAYSTGYRMIDTAAAYGNEIAIAKAIKRLEVPRNELFLQDKLWNTNRGYVEAQEACKKSLRKLKTDYLDAYLIHWPASSRLHENWQEINAETWRGMEQLYKEGYVRAIGVCNYKVHHLEELSKTAEIMPHMNQIEIHPGMRQKEIVCYCTKNGILVEASSPLGNGKILENEVLKEIAQKYNKTTAQICLRWAIQKEYVVLPKSEKEERVAQNVDIFNFFLSKEEEMKIDEIPFCGGLGFDADEVIEFG